MTQMAGLHCMDLWWDGHPPVLSDLPRIELPPSFLDELRLPADLKQSTIRLLASLLKEDLTFPTVLGYPVEAKDFLSLACRFPGIMERVEFSSREGSDLVQDFHVVAEAAGHQVRSVAIASQVVESDRFHRWANDLLSQRYSERALANAAKVAQTGRPGSFRLAFEIVAALNQNGSANPLSTEGLILLAETDLLGKLIDLPVVSRSIIDHLDYDNFVPLLARTLSGLAKDSIRVFGRTVGATVCDTALERGSLPDPSSLLRQLPRSFTIGFCETFSQMCGSSMLPFESAVSARITLTGASYAKYQRAISDQTYRDLLGVLVGDYKELSVALGDSVVPVNHVLISALLQENYVSARLAATKAEKQDLELTARQLGPNARRLEKVLSDTKFTPEQLAEFSWEVSANNLAFLAAGCAKLCTTGSSEVATLAIFGNKYANLGDGFASALQSAASRAIMEHYRAHGEVFVPAAAKMALSRLPSHQRHALTLCIHADSPTAITTILQETLTQEKLIVHLGLIYQRLAEQEPCDRRDLDREFADILSRVGDPISCATAALVGAYTVQRSDHWISLVFEALRIADQQRPKIAPFQMARVPRAIGLYLDRAARRASGPAAEKLARVAYANLSRSTYRWCVRVLEKAHS